MEKLIDPVSRLDVIKAFTFMNYPNNVRVIRVLMIRIGQKITVKVIGLYTKKGCWISEVY